MAINISLDEKSVEEIDALAKALKISKSRLVRMAIRDLYLKEKRAENNLIFFVDQYNEGVISKDMLFLLLPREDAEAIIIGSRFGKEAVKIAKGFDS